MSNKFSVSQVNEYVKMLLDSSSVMSDLWVVGEISNFKNHYSTGHLYFSLKDESSIIKCVMFRGNASQLRFVPEDGMKVLIHGRVSSYTARGEYQIYADSMQPDGIGALAKAFEQLKIKLGAEGLFDSAHKKQIPAMPTRVGVITSASGAAIHDILNVSGRRAPGVEIVIYPAQVQGEMAPRSLCGGIRYFNEKSPVDVIIIGRGGGSIEDLWEFNDEMLARYIYASNIPVVSAVGHETDFTICDFVSDLRAPTPSAAAEIVFPNMLGIYENVKQLRGILDMKAQKRVEHCKKQISLLSSRLELCSPDRVLNQKMMNVAYLCDKLENQKDSIFNKKKNQLSLLYSRLNAADPMTLTSKGYAVVSRGGEVVVRAKGLSDGDKIRIDFSDGKINATVEG